MKHTSKKDTKRTYVDRAIEAIVEPWCKNAITITIAITTRRYSNESEMVGLVPNIGRNHEIFLEQA